MNMKDYRTNQENFIGKSIKEFYLDKSDEFLAYINENLHRLLKGQTLKLRNIMKKYIKNGVGLLFIQLKGIDRSIATNITYLKEQEHKLIEAKEAAEKANQEK